VIQCPICHVLNEDRSLFCAECGQRFTPPAAAHEAPAPMSPPENINPTPPPEAPIKRPAVKLHSPILGGGSEPEEPMPGRNRFANSRFGSGNAPTPDARNRGPARQNFGDEEDNETVPKAKPRKGLHSPLLDFGDDEPEEFDAPAKSQGMFPHRNRLPSNTNQPNTNQPDLGNDPRPPRPQGKGGLRSPLLGGDDVDQYDDNEDDFSNPNQPRKKLRSPVLDGNPRSNRYVPEPVVEIKEESNVLRSPLLAAKVPLAEKPVPGPAPAVPPMPVPPMPVQPANMNQPPAQQGGWPGAPQRPDVAGWPNNPGPGEMQVPLQPPNIQPGPSVVPPNPDSFDQATYDSTFNQPAPVNQAPPLNQGFGNVPPIARDNSWDPPAPSSPAPGYDIPAPGFTPEPTPVPIVKPAPSPAPSSSSGISSLRSRSAGATESGARMDSEAPVDPPILRSKRSSTRLPSALNSEAQPDMFPSKAKHMGFAKFMLFPFFAAAAFKIWYLVAMGPQALSSAPFLGDQVSQLVVIICLIIFTFIATSDA
jgi:hypothetical protein